MSGLSLLHETALSLPEIEAAIIAGLAILALVIAIEDARSLEIREIWLVAFVLLALSQALLFPLVGLPSAIAGGVICGIASFLAGFAASRRAGHQALGGADIYVAVGGGFMLGVNAIGPWMLLFSVTALLAWLISPALSGQRDYDISGGKRDTEHGISVMPLCPVMLLTAFALFGLIRTGFLSAYDPFGLMRLF